MSSWQLVRQPSSTVELTGTGDLEGYTQLWARALFDVEVDYENDGRGIMWPVGKARRAQYTLVLADGTEAKVQTTNLTELMLVMFWVFGTQTGPSYPSLVPARGLDNPKRDRLETIARAHMRLGNAEAAMKEVGLDYMAVIQAPHG